MTEKPMTQEEAEQLKKQLYYDPWSNCPADDCDSCTNFDCAQKQMLEEDRENECDYTGDPCIDSGARQCGCVGCEIITPSEVKNPTCPHCDSVMEEDGELNGEPAYTCQKCKRIIQCTESHIEKLWEDLCGPKPLGLIDSVNKLNVTEKTIGEK